MNAIVLACILLLPPTAPGEPERRHTLEHTWIRAAECPAYAPRYAAECAKRHPGDARIPGARVVAECKAPEPAK